MFLQVCVVQRVLALILKAGLRWGWGRSRQALFHSVR